MVFKEEDIVSRSKDVEIIGEPFRCRDGEYTKFYCIKVRIIFENGEEREYLLRSHGDPKGILNFKENKKGIKDNMKERFFLLRNGEIVFKSWD